MNAPSTPTVTDRLSARVRAATGDAHRAAEGSPVMRRLLAGRLTLGEFAAMQEQLLAVYETLEAVGETHRDDPTIGGFIDTALLRTSALRDDLARLQPGDHTTAPTEPTRAYCERLRTAGSDPVGFVAHHYTRYLGDLSGGQFIGRAVERHLGLDRGTGTAFFHFVGVTDPCAYKERYRERLDATPWSAVEQDRFIEEVQVAYALNAALLVAVPTEAAS